MKLHVAAAKDYILRHLRAGDRTILEGFQGTIAEAIAAVEADPRDFFVLDDGCDRQRPDGSCAGHPVTREEAYDTQIAPLMEQIIAIAREHDIPMVALYQIDDATRGTQDAGHFCETLLVPENASQVLRDIVAMVTPGGTAGLRRLDQALKN